MKKSKKRAHVIFRIVPLREIIVCKSKMEEKNNFMESFLYSTG